VEAFPTRDAVLFSNRLHKGREAMFRYFKDISAWNIDTGLNAAETHHAPIKPLPDQGSPIFRRWDLSFLRGKFILLDSEFIGAVLKLAFPSGIADRAVEGMIDQQKLQGLQPHLLHSVSARADHHPIDHRGRARGQGHFRPFHIDQADTARFEQAQFGMVT